MPHDLVLAKSHNRDRSLGWLAVAWQEHFCIHGPGDIYGEKVVLDDELVTLSLDAYALDARGRRLYDSVFFSRPKGRDKSGQSARWCLFEALGPCRFAGWAEGGEVFRQLDFEYVYRPGEPMGRFVTSPFVRIMATEEGQTGNIYDAVHANLTDGPLVKVQGIKVGLGGIMLPQKGQLVYSTRSSASKDGGKETHTALDETHLYTTPALRDMAATVRRNSVKRKIAQPWISEMSTMYAAGENSVAEESHRLAVAISEGRIKNPRFMFDHCGTAYPSDEDLKSDKRLKQLLREAYGQAAGWTDIDRILATEFRDPRKKMNDSIRFFLNCPTVGSDAYMDPGAWAKGKRVDDPLRPGEAIALGFDGSRSDDSTFIVACRLRDRRLFALAAWEKPPGQDGDGWTVPRREVDESVREIFSVFQVSLMYCDPSGWQSYIDEWSLAFPDQIVEFFPASQRKAMAEALDRFKEDVIEGRVTHNGSPILTRHVLNAQNSRNGQISKPRQSDKIDGCVAAVLSLEAASVSEDLSYDVLESFY
jgi:phage terminase large subunit-like protein